MMERPDVAEGEDEDETAETAAAIVLNWRCSCEKSSEKRAKEEITCIL